MESVKSIFINNDINIIRYEIKGNKINVHIINKERSELSKITFIVIYKKYECEINSNNEVIETEFEIDDSHFVSVPKIFSYVINGVNKKFDTTNKQYIKEARLLNDVSKRNRKRIIKNIYEETGNKVDKAYYPFEDENYWSCYCGEINFTNKCYRCGCDKEYSKCLTSKIEERKSYIRNFDFIEANLFTWQMIVFVFHILFVNIIFNGDILYGNLDLISFFSVLNRFIIPILIIGCSAILSFRSYKLDKRIDYLIRGMRLLMLSYLDVIVFVSFANVSYNFFITTGFNFIFLTGAIKRIIKKNDKVKYSFMSVFLVGSILFSFSSIIVLRQYDFKVGMNEIYIQPDSIESYQTPVVVNNLPVTRIDFIRNNKDYTKLKEIYISKNVNSIVISSPEVTPNLEKIILDENNKYFVLDDDVLYYKDTHKVALIPSAKEEVRISNERVYQKGFSNWKKLKKVTISSSTRFIDDYAFEGCYKLENIVFEDNSSLEKIGEYAFSSCISLMNIDVPSSVKEINFGVFANCISLKNMTLPFIGKMRYTEYDTMNKNILEYIFANDYSNISIDNLTITNQAIVQNSSFYKCPVKNIIINSFDGSFGYNCFAYSSLESIVIPEGVTVLGENSFRGCKQLKNIVLPSTLQRIEKNAFLEDVSLINVDYSKVNTENLIVEEGNQKLLDIILK